MASSSARLLQRPIQGLLKDNKKSCAISFAFREIDEPKQTALWESDTKATTKFGTREFEEIKFSVPWGHISGKWYGPKNTRPIVGFHGWQDNAGTFDTIAPFLPSHVGFLAVDLPGHGLSSWLPDGLQSTEIVIQRIAKRMENFNKADARNRSKKEPPSYRFEELVERLHEGTEKSIEKDVCQFILQRNVKKSEQDFTKYYFSRDSRLKDLMLYDLPQDLVVEMAKRITCPHLFIKALQGPYYESKRNYYEVLEILKEKPNFEYHEVEGKHHVHLNEPKKIADIINPFILKHRPE